MASGTSKDDRHISGDQRQRDLSSIEGKHHNLIDEKSDYTVPVTPNIHDITKELITKESEHNRMVPDSESIAQSSCTLSTIISMEDNHDDESKRKSTESSDSEIVVIDSENVGSNAGSSTQSNHNSDAANELPKVKRYDPTIDERLPETVTLLTRPDGGKLYLVGTAHFSVESQNDVSKIIQAVQPQIVVVELCKARVGILQLDEEVMFRYAKNISYQFIMDTIRKEGLYNGLLHILLLRMAAHVAKELGMPPGGEFRRAFEEAKNVPNCIIHMADRPINITMQRAMRSLSWWQTIKLGWHLMMMKGPITKEDVELCKQRSMLDEMIASMNGEFPVLGEVFVKERDTYLTYSLQLACMPQCTPNGIQPARVVGIVGLGHTPGIIENWGKVKHSDIPPIMSVPPPSSSSKILMMTIKASVLGAVIYVGYKIVAVPAAATFQSIKSSVEGLLKTIIVTMEATASADEYEHVITDVMYVANNIPGPGIDVTDFESEYSVGCSCMVECYDCSCTRGSPNYSDGRIIDEKLVGPVFECNARCQCRSNCGNKLVQNGPLNCLTIREIADKGVGLFTTSIIKKGQFICEYAGEVIGLLEARRRVEVNKKHNAMNYVLVVREHIGDRIIVTCIDPKYFGNIGRYANHSCDPNSILVPVRIEGIMPRLCLFASRQIANEEEVTFDYAGGPVVNSVHCLSDTPCLCNSDNCFGYLPHNSI